jgi:hypothetical protein
MKPGIDGRKGTTPAKPEAPKAEAAAKPSKATIVKPGATPAKVAPKAQATAATPPKKATARRSTTDDKPTKRARPKLEDEG